jgi:hypothetical protein
MRAAQLPGNGIARASVTSHRRISASDHMTVPGPTGSPGTRSGPAGSPGTGSGGGAGIGGSPGIGSVGGGSPGVGRSGPPGSGLPGFVMGRLLRCALTRALHVAERPPTIACSRHAPDSLGDASVANAWKALAMHRPARGRMIQSWQLAEATLGRTRWHLCPWGWPQAKGSPASGGAASASHLEPKWPSDRRVVAQRKRHRRLTRLASATTHGPCERLGWVDFRRPASGRLGNGTDISTNRQRPFAARRKVRFYAIVKPATYERLR